MNGRIDWNFNLNHFKDMHDYNTRFNSSICKPQSKRLWGQHRFACHAVDDWNALPDGIRNISDFLVFRRLIRRNMQSLLLTLYSYPLHRYLHLYFFSILALDLCRASLKAHFVTWAFSPPGKLMLWNLRYDTTVSKYGCMSTRNLGRDIVRMTEQPSIPVSRSRR